MATPSKDVIGTWADVFGASPPEVQALALALAALIRRVHPEVVVVARPGDGR